MEAKEKVLSEKRKKNMKVYSIHRMLTFDLLFYYAIKFLFLTQIKGFKSEDVVIASACWGLFRVLFQVPITTYIDKFGNKKSLITANILQAIGTIVLMSSENMYTLILANLFGGIAYAMKEVAETEILNLSIPETENKSQIYSKIDGKATGNYYYLSAISAILSGILFDVNGYIPMTISVIVQLLATRIACEFEDINLNEKRLENTGENIKKTFKQYIKNLRLAFSFIFNSRRLKALMIFSGVMYGIIMVMGTYEMNLLDAIGISATGIGIIYAIMQVIAGMSSKAHNKFHEKYRNKSLTIIGISYTLACLIAGIISSVQIPSFIVIGIIIITYIIRYTDTGLYFVLIKKYMTNFTNLEVANKVYAANELVTGIGNSIICIFGAIIVSHNSIMKSMIIFGIVFLVIMILVLQYMKTRVGLKPNDYRKKDINYKEYISLK